MPSNWRYIQTINNEKHMQEESAVMGKWRHPLR